MPECRRHYLRLFVFDKGDKQGEKVLVSPLDPQRLAKLSNFVGDQVADPPALISCKLDRLGDNYCVNFVLWQHLCERDAALDAVESYAVVLGLSVVDPRENIQQLSFREHVGHSLDHSVHHDARLLAHRRRRVVRRPQERLKQTALVLG